MALGAFLAGMVVGQSALSQQAAADALPLRDAFAVLFFVSVGMLFEPSFLVREPLLLLAGLAVVLIAKPLAALAVVAVLGYSSRTALVVAWALRRSASSRSSSPTWRASHGLFSETGIQPAGRLRHRLDRAQPVPVRRAGTLRRGDSPPAVVVHAAEPRSLKKRDAMNAATTAAIAASTEPLAVIVGYGPVGQAVERCCANAAPRP